HGGTLHGLVPGADAAAISGDRIGSVGDPRLREVAAWARAGATAATAAGRRPPGPAAHLPELIGVAVAFQYLNRMAHVFLGGSPARAAHGEGRVPGGPAGGGRLPGGTGRPFAGRADLVGQPGGGPSGRNVDVRRRDRSCGRPGGSGPAMTVPRSRAAPWPAL